MRRTFHQATSGPQPRGRWGLAVLALLLVAASVGSVEGDVPNG